jgi:hypothetical protein
VVGAHEVDRPVREPGAQRRAVARAAQRRYQAALRIEPADVDVAEVQVMHGDIAGQRHSIRFRGAHHRDAFRGRQPAEWTRTPVWRTSARIDRERDRLRRGGNRGQAEARRNLAVVRDAVLPRCASSARNQTR